MLKVNDRIRPKGRHTYDIKTESFLIGITLDHQLWTVKSITSNQVVLTNLSWAGMTLTMNLEKLQEMFDVGTVTVGSIKPYMVNAEEDTYHVRNNPDGVKGNM